MVGIDVTTILFLLHDDVTVQGRQRRLRLRDDADIMMTMLLLLLLLALPNYNYIAIHVLTSGSADVIVAMFLLPDSRVLKKVPIKILPSECTWVRGFECTPMYATPRSFIDAGVHGCMYTQSLLPTYTLTVKF